MDRCHQCHCSEILLNLVEQSLRSRCGVCHCMRTPATLLTSPCLTSSPPACLEMTPAGMCPGTPELKMTPTTLSTVPMPAHQPVSEVTATPTATVQRRITLRNWHFKVLLNREILVQGNRDEMRVWCSSPVVERLSPTVVATRSGSHYYLLGGLNRAEMLTTVPSDCLSVQETVLQKFQYGFPRDWRALVNSMFPPPSSSLPPPSSLLPRQPSPLPPSVYPKGKDPLLSDKSGISKNLPPDDDDDAVLSYYFLMKEVKHEKMDTDSHLPTLSASNYASCGGRSEMADQATELRTSSVSRPSEDHISHRKKPQKAHRVAQLARMSPKLPDYQRRMANWTAKLGGMLGGMESPRLPEHPISHRDRAVAEKIKKKWHKRPHKAVPKAVPKLSMKPLKTAKSSKVLQQNLRSIRTGQMMVLRDLDTSSDSIFSEDEDTM